MNKLLLALASMLIPALLHAQDTAPGFFISNTNDSVPVQVRLPKSKLFDVLKVGKFMEEVDVADPSGAVKNLKPADIKSYGFQNAGRYYRFFSKPVKNGSLKFLQPVVLGPKACLYQYVVVSSGGGGLSNRQVFYTFENTGNTYAFLSNASGLNRFREELSTLYKDYPEVLQLIETKFQKRISIDADIREVLEAVNRS